MVSEQLHLKRARTKFTRGLANFRSNTGEAHFLSPELVDPALLPRAPSTPFEAVAAARAADEAASASAPAGKRRRDKIFGESGIRLHGVPPSAPAPSSSSDASFANSRALARRAVPNPKVIPNPKWTKSSGNTAKTGSVGLTNYGEGTIFYGSLKIGSSAQSFSVNIDTGYARSQTCSHHD